MTKQYQQAVFQPTVRPSWAGSIKYIPQEETKQILEAILRFPNEIEINSTFWDDVIKPDLELQYEKFLANCESRCRISRDYWNKHKDTSRIPQGYLEDTSNKGKDKDNTKDKDKDNSKDKDKDESNGKDKDEDKSKNEDKDNFFINNFIKETEEGKSFQYPF